MTDAPAVQRRAAMPTTRPIKAAPPPGLLQTFQVKLGGRDAAAVTAEGAVRGSTPASAAEASFREGILAMRKGDVAGAAERFAQAIARDPRHTGAHNNLGIALRRQGKLDEAIVCYRLALLRDPGHAPAHNNLGEALASKGEDAEAIASYARAVSSDPAYVDAHFNLGNLHFAKGRFAKAAASFGRVVELRPDHSVALNGLALSLEKLGRLDEALLHYRRALAIKPGDPHIRFNMILALKDNGRLAEAVDCCRQILAARPTFAEGHSNLGAVLQAQGKFQEAMACYRRALELKPHYPDAQVNAALLHLMHGEFEAGWQKYEWRFERLDYDKRNFKQPMWQGEPLAEKRLLLHAEQGFGDSIHFLRYLPRVLALGGGVVVEVQPALVRLTAGIPGHFTVVSKGAALPAFDLHCPLASLPRIFATRLESIPAEVPYLFPRKATVNRWARLLGAGPGLKIGLVWAGSPRHVNDRNRSLPLALLKPLIEAVPARWFSLQTGPAARELATFPPGTLRDLSKQLKDFSETAGLLANLDLIISADTAPVHLAGALARPAWVMVPFVPDWRWLLGRESSPWYPTLRLFRQPALGDWESVIKRITAELGRLAASRRATVAAKRR